MTRKFSRIFSGWWIVLSCAIICFFVNGFVTLGLSVIFKPLASDLGLSRAATSMAPGIQSVSNGICGPLGGWASDKYGPRIFMLIGIFFVVLGLILMYFVESLWTLLVVWGIIVGVGFSLSATNITDKAIVNWFVKRSGIALNTKFAIQSLSGLLLLPIIAWLMENHGWRMTCLVSGIIIALVGFPLVLLFIKPHPPEYYGLLPDGNTKEGLPLNIDNQGGNATIVKVQEFNIRQAIKTPAYWLIISLVFIGGLATPLMAVHCINFLTDIGINVVKAATMVGLATTVSIPARLVTGFIVDKIKNNNLRFIMMTGYALQAIGIASFLIIGKIAFIYTGLILYGVGQGISFSVQIPMWARFFGRKSFGVLVGLQIMMSIPIGLFGPTYIGWIYDKTLSYTGIFGLVSALLAVCTIVTCFILPPKPQLSTADIPKM